MDENIQIKVSTDTASLREMRQEMKNLQIQMTETTDPAKFKALEKQFAILRNDMQDTNKAMKYLDPGEILSGWVKFGQGAVGAFGAITGAASLFGVENEKLQNIEKKSMQLIQTMIGLEQARQVLIDGGGIKQLKILAQTTAAQLTQITTVKIATAAQRVWNAVVSANPIMLLVTAIAALATGITILVRKQREEKEETEKLSEALDTKLNKSLETSKKSLDKTETALNNVNIQLKLQRGEISKKDYDIYIAKQEKLGKLEEARLKYLPLLIEAQRALNDVINNGVVTSKDKERYDKALENLNNYKTEYSNTISEINKEYTLNVEKAVQAEKEKNDKIVKSNKEKNDKIVKSNEEALKKQMDDIEALKKFQEKSLIEEEERKATEKEKQRDDAEFLKALNLEVYTDEQRLIEETTRKQREDADALLEYKKQNSAYDESKFKEVMNNIDQYSWAAQESMRAMMDIEDIYYQNKQAKMDKDFAMKTSGMSKETKEYQIELKKHEMEEYNLAKKSFETKKKMSIATATIDMLAGIVAAFARNGLIMAIIQAALALTTGIINIAKIKATTFESPNPSASAPQQPSTPDDNTNTPEVLQAPQFFGLGQQVSNINTQKPLKVYVTEGDITATQNKVRVIEDRAIF